MAHVLVVGGGGREHALAWKLAQSPKVATVYVSPGNAGTGQDEKICNVALNVKDAGSVGTWCKDNQVSLVVVGPEDPLANGMADVLNNMGVPCFGPSAKAAQIEASKEFAKSFMCRHNIPTARWKSFTDAAVACKHINSAPYAALVVKASGLAAGKGVVVAADKEEACKAASSMLQDRLFGVAGSTVVVEELLQGPEVSCLAFSDGSTILCMPPAQDHKRLLEGDQGPNTGGMGAYCPCPLVSPRDLKVIQQEVLQKAVDGLKSEGMPYVGVLYAGLMLTADGPKVLEYNCRFGDPETQVLLPLMQSDLYDVCQACVSGTLHQMTACFSTDRSAVAVVTVSGGYPGSYPKGLPITGLADVEEGLDQLVFHAGTAMKDQQLSTSGGRVLAVVAVETDLAAAAHRASLGASLVQYKDKFYRRDIAHAALHKGKSQLTYQAAGVDIEAGDSLVGHIKPLAKATQRAGCLGELGQFGGLFHPAAAGYKDPVLVSGTDGVGTKLKIAQESCSHRSIGIDLVAMCVNDVLCHGAEPLFFLDYLACGSLNVAVAADVVAGVAEGCKLAGCTLLGGETAEMPGMYADGCYDLAGFAVGAVERGDALPRIQEVVPGDVLIGLPSSGLHSNGFSLVRKVLSRCGLKYSDPCPFSDSGKTVGEELLIPTKIYSKALLPALRSGKVKAMAHITGGGLPGNVNRVLPPGCGASLDARKWNVQSVYGWLTMQGNISSKEMCRAFNCGIGAVLIASASDAETVLQQLQGAGESASVIGSITQRESNKEQVLVENLDEGLAKAYLDTRRNIPQQLNGDQPCCRVAVLISGSGTNLQALLDHTRNPAHDSSAEIVLVVSNKPGVQGLARAAAAGVPTKVISHKDYSSRVEFDMAVHKELQAARVDLVCLAGFMRILSAEFVKLWEGKMLNVHPSLLPSFKGANAHKLVLEAGVRLSGCTVHFVAAEVDAGAILVQESVPVLPGDTEDSLAERIKTVEHKAFPQAMELVASGAVSLGPQGGVVWH